MPMLPAPSLIPLALVTLLLFMASLYGLSALGHFPRAARQDALLRGAGPLILWSSIAAVTCSVTLALVAAWQTIPWYAAIIGGGAAILVAPLTLQYFSDRFVDGRGALVLFSGVTLVLAAGLTCYIGG